MPRYRDSIPDDLKEFIALCRAGRLFAVQDWISAGKRFRMPEGKFATWPLRVALDTDFHSLVEVLLRAGVDQGELDHAAWGARRSRRLDYLELLAEYGADIDSISTDDVISCREPAIIRWFLNRGLDLEEGYPIARAFQDGHRDFLGIYTDVRNKVPSARMQAAMALRYHVREGNLK